MKSILLNKFCGFVFLFLTYGFSVAQQWPINETDDPSNYNRISATFGEIHPTNGDHFHGAIDIDNDVINCPARSIQDGRVYAIGTISIGIEHEYGGNEIYHRRSRYLHVTADSDLELNDDVYQGDEIATIENSSATSGNHLHFEMWQFQNGEWFRVNPINNDLGWELVNPIDSYLPEINDLIIQPLSQPNNVASGFEILSTTGAISEYQSNNIKIHFKDRSGSTGSVFDSNADKLIVYGNLGMILSARDIAINSTASAGLGLTIQNVSYSINKNLKYNIEFDRVRDGELYQVEQIFHTGFNSSGDQLFGNNDFIELRSLDNIYLFPNKEINSIQSNGIWYTKAKKSTNHVFNTTPTDAAQLSSEALYNDGFNELDFEIEDAQGQIDNIEIALIVDNFKPFVQKVTISTGTFIGYSKQWVWDNTSGSQQLVEITSEDYLYETDVLDINVRASEAMSEMHISIPSLGINQQPMESVTPTNERDSPGQLWSYTTKVLKGSSGQHQIEFRGKDLADNDIIHDATEVPFRAANGAWANEVPGLPVDANHSFWIESSGCDEGGGIEFERTEEGGGCDLVAFFTTGMGTLYTVNFTDRSTPRSDIVSWNWDFGDGFYKQTQNPSHIYREAGVYDVTLTVSDGSQTDTFVRSITVTEAASEEYDVMISSSNVLTAEPPFNATFSANVASGITPSQYNWMVSPSVSSNITSGENTGNVTIEFENSGIYEVYLQVIGTNGVMYESNTLSVTALAEGGPVPNFGWVEDQPFVNAALHFWDNSTYSCSGFAQRKFTVTFNGTFSSQVVGESGWASAPEDFAFYPQEIGSYSVEYCIVDNCGVESCQTKYFDVVKFVPTIEPNFSLSSTELRVGETLTITDLSVPQSEISEWFWWFKRDLDQDWGHADHDSRSWDCSDYANSAWGDYCYDGAGWESYQSVFNKVQNEPGEFKVMLAISEYPEQYMEGLQNMASVVKTFRVIDDGYYPNTYEAVPLSGRPIKLAGDYFAHVIEDDYTSHKVQVHKKVNGQWMPLATLSSGSGRPRVNLAMTENAIVTRIGGVASSKISVFEKGQEWTSQEAPFQTISFPANQRYLVDEDRGTALAYDNTPYNVNYMDMKGNVLAFVNQESEGQLLKNYLYIYERGPGNWQQKGKWLVNLNADATIHVSVDDNTVVLGVDNGEYSNMQDDYFIRIFSRSSSGSWTYYDFTDTKLDKYCDVVSVSGNTIVVQRHSSESWAELLVFEKSGSYWSSSSPVASLQAEQFHPDYTSNDIQRTMVIQDDNIVWQADESNVLLFKRPDGGWVDMTETDKFLPIETQVWGFVSNIAFEGNTLILNGNLSTDATGSTPGNLAFYEIEGEFCDDYEVIDEMTINSGQYLTNLKGVVDVGGPVGVVINSGGNAQLRGTLITLKPGFHAKSGSNVTIESTTCDNY